MQGERGTLWSLWAVAATWGINVVMVKYLTGMFSPVALVALRITMAAVLLLVLWRWRWSGGAGWPKDRKAWIGIFAAGFLSIYLHQLCLATGVRWASAGVASIILAMNPLITSVSAHWLFGESFGWRQAMGVLLGFGGVSLAVLRGGEAWIAGPEALRGEALVFVAMLVYVAGGLVIRWIGPRAGAMDITTFSHLFASVLLLGTATGTGVWGEDAGWPLDVWPWIVMILSGWGATALGTMFWNVGIQRIGATRTSIFLNTTPAAGVIFGGIFLHEHIGIPEVAGLLLVVAGVYLGSRKSAVRPPKGAAPSTGAISR
ncbi:MAG TPA: DMT family transporter [Alicyclobacillus sp.]|nr:DMT family transporter [Alicyclobacillus sp.]